MFIILLIFHITSTIFSLSNFNNNICLSYYKSSPDEKTLISQLKENSELLISKERNIKKSNSCIALLVYTGNYNALEYYLNLLSKKGVQYRDTLKLYLSSLISKLTHIESRYKFSENDYKKIVPAMKWAQSMDQIYILIKFADSFENPACLELNNLDYKFDSKKFNLKAFCILKEKPIEFIVDMKLWNVIVPKNSSFELNKGIGTVIMSKENNKTIWENLYEDGQDFNLKIWYEMKEKHYNELKENGYVEKNNKEFEEWKKKKEENLKEEERKNKEKMEYKKKLKEEKGKNHFHDHDHDHHDEKNGKSSLNENILNTITSDL